MTDETLLPPYIGIDARSIVVVNSPAEALIASRELAAADVLGFDTESKPVFMKGQVSQGPHLIQLATQDKVFLFPIRRGEAYPALQAILESTSILKVGFGLGDDQQRLFAKLGITTQHVLDLARALRTDSRSDVGAKTAVAQFFGQKLQKSKKISTSNWALLPLTDKQKQYAADDAHVALKIYRAWQAQRDPL
ncbi:3'-5' exonuclease domain-containing protein 2 [Deefgea piscis]|uniref:3'-5' exonuclease domain-containing protein 2 n=1 Tax=Deefgea piscis TaxID=2739061 RepID=A0A6M8SMI7_9NEIS|nr:3'-5' exonuclease [Deefgea piscis]QKJ65458.1 3'-5' exonuclease domain-containing protein 2 [Deefgea piscis]